MIYKRYSNEEQEAFIEVAKEEGISRAMRILNYPDSWNTANRWFTARSINPPVIDEVKQKAVQMREMYGDKEAMVLLQQGLERIQETYNTADLTADDQKKLAEALQKLLNTMLLIQGKSTNITETRKHFTEDIELNKLIEDQEKLNEEKAESLSNVTEQ